MPEELLPFDAEQYTKGRLSQTDPDVVRALASAKARVRNYCGWHVSPVLEETITLDGSGGRFLFLPTLKVVALTEIEIDGEAIDLSEVKELATAPGVLYRQDGWPCGYSNIAVTLSHGYTQYECQDWREAVLALVDQASMSAGSGGAGPLASKRVDDIELRWSTHADEIDIDRAVLDHYRRKWWAL